MKEIIFKAKRIDNQEWVYGDLINCYNGKKRIVQELPGELDGDLTIENNLVDPKTVCQFTGMLDKRDIKIFEGDIVDNGRTAWVVVWHQQGCKWYLEYVTGYTELTGIHTVFENSDLGDGYLKRRDLKVTRNIHD